MICKVVLTLLCILSSFMFIGIGLRINSSESLPGKLYLSIPCTIPEKDQIISFSMPMSNVTFAKIISGVPGDLVEVKEKIVTVNGVPKGEVIKGCDPIQQQTIPEGFYFVLGTHEESFDSRYEEFGLVPLTAIKGRLCPIF